MYRLCSQGCNTSIRPPAPSILPQSPFEVNIIRKKDTEINFLDRICSEYNFHKPRMYRENARKAYLALAKCRKRTDKRIRKAIGRQFRFIICLFRTTTLKIDFRDITIPQRAKNPRTHHKDKCGGDYGVVCGYPAERACGAGYNRSLACECFLLLVVVYLNTVNVRRTIFMGKSQLYRSCVYIIDSNYRTISDSFRKNNSAFSGRQILAI